MEIFSCKMPWKCKVWKHLLIFWPQLINSLGLRYYSRKTTLLKWMCGFFEENDLLILPAFLIGRFFAIYKWSTSAAKLFPFKDTVKTRFAVSKGWFFCFWDFQVFHSSNLLLHLVLNWTRDVYLRHYLVEIFLCWLNY